MANWMHFQYAIYLLPQAPVHRDVLAILRTLLKEYPEVTLVDEIPPQPQALFVQAYLEKHAREKYAPPDLKSLRYSGHGLTDDEGVELQSCNQALLLDFGYPKKYVWTGLRTANAIVDALVQKIGGFAWDQETREVFSSDAWHKRRVASWTGVVPDVTNQTVIHIYDNGGSVRAITLGMLKMGLPDVTMNSSGWSSEKQVGNLINIFSQCLAEGAPVREIGDFRLSLHALRNSEFRDSQLKSIKGKGLALACLSVKPSESEEGDPKNRLIHLGADKYPGADSNAQQESMISSFFGSEDAISKIKDSDELLVASAKAKAKLPELQKAFAAGLEPGEFIDVKAPFQAENGGNEWMWVEVTKWTGDEIQGTLENDPQEIPYLRAGQKVKVRQQDVFDYLHHFSDKRTEGNTTGEIISKMTKNEGRSRPVTGEITFPECSN